MEDGKVGIALREIRESVAVHGHARPQLLTIPESAAALRISRSYLYELIASGEFRPVRLGRLVRIDARDIESWIEDQKSAKRGSPIRPGDTRDRRGFWGFVAVETTVVQTSPRVQPAPPRNLFRDDRTSDILTALELWSWDLAEFDTDVAREPLSWKSPASTRSFIVAHIEDAVAEIQRRENLRNQVGAPPWPTRWRNYRHDATDIKDRISITDYLRARGVDVMFRGNRGWAVCPFHVEKTASFSVSQDDRLFHCFSCGRGGDVFTLHLHFEGHHDFSQAVRELAAEAGIAIGGPQS